ncbi:hypothetical protein VN97_g3714 [Penicillium thymicola]|uniref:Uncharacterized protein n=1 Tax=Penicillium thymicola TaxID=293382 RepID=A0AAI9XA65_PENTH|nr:hypothetical protein VN97_g3714 [Penicillium thymicola]
MAISKILIAHLQRTLNLPSSGSDISLDPRSSFRTPYPWLLSDHTPLESTLVHCQDSMTPGVSDQTSLCAPETNIIQSAPAVCLQ